MTDYGRDPEEIHENMHMYRHERHYRGHKIAVGVGHNRAMRKIGGESTKRTHKKAK